MRFIVIFAVAAVAIGAFVPTLFNPRSRPATTANIAAPEPQAPAGSRTVSIRRASDGHFHTEASVDGRRVDMLVDTGASVIALRERDAARLGIHPAARDYSAKISTANGVVLAARVELNRVEVGGITVRNVAAVVLPDEALGKNLLGMSFLSKLRWEQRNGQLTLEQ
ncbi:MAG TPA: TIGR02281 family clan AA aspartic protease [Xanthobacteraceae bacterium]|nr:TIGR02281 family clan AA aspartic protease [Xanthobacteraceae bacterium]